MAVPLRSSVLCGTISLSVPHFSRCILSVPVRSYSSYSSSSTSAASLRKKSLFTFSRSFYHAYHTSSTSSASVRASLTLPKSIPSITNSLPSSSSSSSPSVLLSSSSSSSSTNFSTSCSTSSSSSSSGMIVFNTQMKLQQRNRAAVRPDASEYDYLRDEIALRLVDRLYDINRTEFPITVDLGANTGNIYKALTKNAAIERIRTLHMIDSSPYMLYRDRKEWEKYLDEKYPTPTTTTPSGTSSSSSSLRIIPHVQSLENTPLPFNDQSVDLVLSSCSLHWINDIPKVLTEVKRILKPDGIFLCALLGGDTLHELKESFYNADMQLYGGITPHISPMVGIADAGNLISNAGFGIPTVDTDTFTIEYPSPYSLYRHLQNMGENNAVIGLRSGIRKTLFSLTADIYANTYGTPSSSSEPQSGASLSTIPVVSSSSSSSSSSTTIAGSGRTTPVPATYQIIYMIGWAPAPTQPLPKARGSVPKGFGMRKTSLSGTK